MQRINKSIIIPFFDCFDLVVQCLAELASLGLPKDVEVILVNDGSEEIKTQLMLERAKLTFPFFIEVGFSTNRGFSAANNLGASVARGDILYFLSSDVKIVKHFWEVDAQGIVCGLWYGGRYLTYDTGWNKFNGKVFPYLEGWFIACSAEGFRNIGGWDENYDPHDYEDIDLSVRVLDIDSENVRGWRLREFPSGYVVHLGCGTIGRKKSVEERQKITERNRKYFEEKWKEKIYA